MASASAALWAFSTPSRIIMRVAQHFSILFPLALASFAASAFAPIAIPLSVRRCSAPATPPTLYMSTTRQKQLDDAFDDTELSKLLGKRAGIRQDKVATTPPADEEPTFEEIDDDAIQAMAETVDLLGDDMPEFKTQRSSRSLRREKGLDPDASSDAGEGKDGEEEEILFVDWMADYEDENELHIPNRIGFGTGAWGDESKGFRGTKLTKKLRREGLYNKKDLKEAYKLMIERGISFIDTSESYGYKSLRDGMSAEQILGEFLQEIEPGDKPLVASTFANPWVHAARSKRLPRFGSRSVVKAAEASIDRMGLYTMELYQAQSPRMYLGGRTALAKGLADSIVDEHTKYVGVHNMGASDLLKFQEKLKKNGETLTSNQFAFSLTNRKALKSGLIKACKKLGIVPLANSVLDGGLATGKYTQANPTGGETSEDGATGPFSTDKLLKLDPIFTAQETLCVRVKKRLQEKMNAFEDDGRGMPKVNTDITTTQIAINYVKAKGAVPIVGVKSPKEAQELLDCVGWDLTEEEVDMLDKACDLVGL